MCREANFLMLTMDSSWPYQSNPRLDGLMVMSASVNTVLPPSRPYPAMVTVNLLHLIPPIRFQCTSLTHELTLDTDRRLVQAPHVLVKLKQVDGNVRPLLPSIEADQALAAVRLRHPPEMGTEEAVGGLQGSAQVILTGGCDVRV